MVCVGQNFLFQPRTAPLRQGSQAQKGIRNKFAHQGNRRARELSECQGSLCRRCPASSRPVPPHRASRYSGASRSPSGLPRSPGRASAAEPQALAIPPAELGDPRRPCSHCGPRRPTPRRLPYLRLQSRPRRPPATPASSSPCSARSRRQEQRRLSQAAGGGSEKSRGLRGSCGFSLPPTAARPRPISVSANPQPFLHADSAHSSPPSGPSDQMSRQKESKPESLVLGPPRRI